MTELLDVFRRRVRLRHPDWDVTRVLLVVAAVVGVAGMAWAILSRPAGDVTSAKAGEPAETTVGAAPFAPTTTLLPGTTAPAALIVDVAGAVHRPGPVRVPNGARVEDAIRLAGGPGAEADLERVDRAATLRDGDRIYVPRRGQTDLPVVVGPGGSEGAPTGGRAENTGGTTAGLVDLNTATAEQLETLPGVGPSTAQAILERRQAQGRFASVEDLLDVKGIGPAKFAAIKPRVTL